MNLTGNGQFQNGNKIATVNNGRKHEKTMIKELLADKIINLDEKLYEIAIDLLNSKNQRIRLMAWKELIKYRLPKYNIVSNSYPNSIAELVASFED